MKELRAHELGFISGGQADFSNVETGFSTSGGVKEVEQKPAVIEVLETYLKGKAFGWI